MRQRLASFSHRKVTMKNLSLLILALALFAPGCTERNPAALDSQVVKKDGSVAPDKTVPKPDKGVPKKDGLPPKPDKAVPVPDKAVPVPDKAVPVPDKAVPVPDKAVPVPDKAVPVPDKAVPVPDKAVPTPDKAVPAPDKGGPLTNASCAGAKAIAFSGSKVTVTGTTTGNANEYGTGINCGNYTSVMASSQTYYKVNLVGGQSYRFGLASKFYYARLYLFTGCGINKINNDCGSGGKTGDVTNSIYTNQTGYLYFVAPYTGTFYLAVDGTNPNYTGGFSLTVEKYTIPTNTTCTKAQVLKLVNNAVSVNGTTTTAKNEFGQTIKCGGLYTYYGKQVYYTIQLTKGKTYRVSLSPSFYANYYIFRSACQANSINADCGSSGKYGLISPLVYTNQTHTSTFKPQASGWYTIAVDSRYTSTAYEGTFTLEVEDWVPSTNTTCAKAKALTFASGKAYVKGSTSGAANEYGSSILCGLGSSYYALKGPQVYYSVTLKKGQAYRFKYKPSFTSRYYVFTKCGASAINSDCGSQGKTGLISNYAYSGYITTNVFTPSAAGTYYIAVDSTAASYQGSFELWVEEFIPPSNGKCATPQQITLVNGKGSVSGSTIALNNEYGTQILCGQTYPTYAFAGKQAYYWVTLTKGKSYKISLTPSFYAGFYVFRTCGASAINADCSSKGKTGLFKGYVTTNTTGVETFTPTVGGIYRIAVDTRYVAYSGTFKLAVEEFTPPKNGTCAGAATMTVPSTVSSSTVGLTNEYGTQIYCGNLSTVMRGPQAYYKLSLTAGKTYTFSFTPSYYYARLYIFGGTCNPSAINTDCSSGGKTGTVSGYVTTGMTTQVSFTPSKTGTYHVALDATYVSGSYGSGPFTLSVK